MEGTWIVVKGCVDEADRLAKLLVDACDQAGPERSHGAGAADGDDWPSTRIL